MSTQSSMPLRELWALLADTAGIIAAIFFMKSQIDDAITTLNLPRELNFYFIAFWAFVGAMIGGFIWNMLLRITKQTTVLGGTGSEPQGILAIAWPIVTTLPLMIILILINRQYTFIDTRQQVLLYITFLVGITIGSAIFYNLPIGGEVGLRRYFDAQEFSFLRKEFILVILWTLLLSMGFLVAALTKLLVVQSVNLNGILVGLFKQIGLTVLFTTLAVVFFLLAFPEQPRFETARGIIAGLFLRAALFWGLLFV